MMIRDKYFTSSKKILHGKKQLDQIRNMKLNIQARNIINDCERNFPEVQSVRLRPSKQDMKSVVLRKHEFEFQDESISQTIPAFLIHQLLNAEKGLMVSLSQCCLKRKIISVAILVEEIKSERKKMKLNIENCQKLQHWSYLDFEQSNARNIRFNSKLKSHLKTECVRFKHRNKE